LLDNKTNEKAGGRLTGGGIGTRLSSSEAVGGSGGEGANRMVNSVPSLGLFPMLLLCSYYQSIPVRVWKCRLFTFWQKQLDLKMIVL